MYSSDPLDDLLTNIQGGLRGGLDFLSIPSGSGGAKKAKRAEDIPGAASKFFFLFFPFSLSLSREERFADEETEIDPLVDLGENVEGGIEGFFDFLGVGGSDE